VPETLGGVQIGHERGDLSALQLFEKLVVNRDVGDAPSGRASEEGGATDVCLIDLNSPLTKSRLTDSVSK
jgi:hypothetical protein